MATVTKLYDPATAKDSYHPDPTSSQRARFWAKEKLVHDLGSIGMPFFEGAGDDPTVLTGYNREHLWLQVSAGVNEVVGTLRFWNQVGDENLLSSWPEMDLDGWRHYFAKTGFAFAGEWDAATNTPTLTSGQGTIGELYRVTVAGTTDLDGNNSWGVGQHFYFDGTVWRPLFSQTNFWGGTLFP